MRRLAAVGLALAALAIFAVLAWPTKYRFEHTTVDGHSVLVRVNRLSGRAEYVDSYSSDAPRWAPVQEAPARSIDEDLREIRAQAKRDSAARRP